MKRIQRWFKEKKREFMDLAIARKIRILLFVVSLLPLVCTLFISNQLSALIIRNQTTELIQANLEQSASNVENFWQTYEGLIQNIYVDDFYIENLKPINQWDSSQYYYAKRKISDRLQNIVQTNEEILGILVASEKYDACFYDSITESSQRSICFEMKRNGENKYIYQAMKEKSIIYSKLHHISNEDGEKDVLYIACQLNDFESFNTQPMGCVMFCIDEQALQDIYGKSNTESNITLLVNEYGDIVSFPLDSLAGVNISDINNREKKMTQEELEQAAVTFLRENQYLKSNHLESVSECIEEGNIYVINVQDYNYAMQDFRYVFIILLFFGILAGFLCMLIAIWFSGQIDGEVQPILYAMKKADKGDLKVQITVRGNDEFAWISQRFNEMIAQIRISNEQEKDALVRKKNAEIKSLEAQINPHFIYNTLDAINWVALERKEYTISRMLTSLATILRYSIHKSNEIVTVRNELEYLKKYVYLQQQRFDYSFLCMIDVEEEVLEYKIHKLLIQPLLENTLVHGFPGNTGMDEIAIRIHDMEDGRMLQIIVEDNGVGMAPEMVEIFNHFDYQKERIESSIGVRNVITRLKLYYGEEGNFFVESGKNGTKITMCIPKGK
ncbi:MAG: histidine kinase [Oliverpabstia sp.]|nr:histidine kinase [Oliverpabstia sp.]